MASAFWLSTGMPGFEGQLILATVATHAALNSRCARSDGGFVTCVRPERQEMITKVQEQMNKEMYLNMDEVIV